MARSQLQVDQEMLRRIAAGESAALGELYDRYGSQSFGLALRIVGNAGDAEEIVQDVFLHVWRQAERYDPARATLIGWILMLTRSRAIDRLRARQARPPLAAHDLDWSHGAADNQEVAAITHEAATRLKAELEALPPPMRQAIELAYFDGLTHSEIAEQLQEPLGTVKSRLRAAMIRLRDTLKGRSDA
jgi:RNA polymerase sigma-70 factor, ECF subfamily